MRYRKIERAAARKALMALRRDIARPQKIAGR